MKTQYLCFPLSIKPTTTTTSSSSISSSATNGRVVPPTASLLDRFREAVFRLIMTTALSKAINTSPLSSSSRNIKSSRNNNRNDYRNSSNLGQDSVRRSCYLYDPYHNEALADCIEFIKKKSASSSPSDHFRHHDDHEIDDDDDDVHIDVETSRDSTASSGVIISLCST